jgi:hypothetical protein
MWARGADAPVLLACPPLTRLTACLLMLIACAEVSRPGSGRHALLSRCENGVLLAAGRRWCGNHPAARHLAGLQRRRRGVVCRAAHHVGAWRLLMACCCERRAGTRRRPPDECAARGAAP